MRVLYPTDGRGPAQAAFELLTSMVRPEMEMTALYVDEFANPAASDAVAAEVFGRVIEHFRATGGEVETVCASGRVKQAIERELSSATYDFVAMGVGNTSTLSRFILGGVSTFVLHRSTVPVLVVHPPPVRRQDPVRVVVGTDGSPPARRAIDALVAIADPKRCEVFVRSVVESVLAAPPFPEMATTPPEAFTRVLTDQTDDADRYMRAAAQRLEDAGFQCDGDVVRGAAEVQLLDAVGERGADLVVVGSRGLGRFASWPLGSVSGHLVRTAPATLVAPDLEPGAET